MVFLASDFVLAAGPTVTPATSYVNYDGEEGVGSLGGGVQIYQRATQRIIATKIIPKGFEPYSDDANNVKVYVSGNAPTTRWELDVFGQNGTGFVNPSLSPQPGNVFGPALMTGLTAAPFVSTTITPFTLGPFPWEGDGFAWVGVGLTPDQTTTLTNALVSVTVPIRRI